MATKHNIALLASLALALTACGGGNAPSSVVASASTVPAASDPGDPAPDSGSVGAGSPATSPATPSVTTPSIPPPSAPSAPAAPTYSQFEGIWAGPTLNSTPGYPGFIVDANGVYWSEDVGWMTPCALPAGMTGTLANGSGTEYQGCAEAAEDSHGSDTLMLSSAVASGGTLTLEGTLAGLCDTYVDGTYYCSLGFESDPFNGAWSYQAALETSPAPAPIASLAGNWTTTWGSPLTINTDGTFVLQDIGDRAVNAEPSGCTYTGQITLVDPNTAVYSVQATVTTLAGAYAISGCTGTATGVFMLLPSGQLAGGLADADGDLSVLDTTT